MLGNLDLSESTRLNATYGVSQVSRIKTMGVHSKH